MTSRPFESSPHHADLRRRVQQLRDAPLMHDVVDLTAGSVHSEAVAAPHSLPARIERLARVFPGLDPSIFGGSVYHLSARHPFIDSPFSWLAASSADEYLAETDEITWGQDLDPGEFKGFLLCHFDVAPASSVIASFDVAATAWANATGHITLQANTGASVSIPVTHPGFRHAIDIGYNAPATGPTEVGFILEPGIQVLAFFGMSIYPRPPILQPDVA